jgi:choline dehydrogenase
MSPPSKTLLSIQHDLIFKKNVTMAEILVGSADILVMSNYWILLPFSRGSVHLGSVDEINTPVCDPRFFLVDFISRHGEASPKVLAFGTNG